MAAVEEYKQTNDMGSEEVGLLDRFLANLGSAIAPTSIFGVDPSKPLAAPGADGTGAAAAGGSGPSHLMEEITDAPQLFEYEDIVHSGHCLMKVRVSLRGASLERNASSQPQPAPLSVARGPAQVVDVVPPKPGQKKKKKRDEWELEYFILLNTKHVVHFQPNTGMVDPFKK